MNSKLFLALVLLGAALFCSPCASVTEGWGKEQEWERKNREADERRKHFQKVEKILKAQGHM